MNPHNFAARSLDADLNITDPGASGTLRPGKNGVCNLISAGAEARTISDPDKDGQELRLVHMTDAGDITVTFSTAYTEDGLTTFVFSDPGQFLDLIAVRTSTTALAWRKRSDHSLGNLTLTETAVLDDLGTLTASAAELNYLDADLATNILTAGAGVSAAETYKTGISRNGSLIITRIVVDLTGLVGSATDLDIIGDTGGAASAHFGQITAAKSGTIVGGKVTCLELPAGGADDIDFYSATVSTGAQDVDVTTLTETVLITSGGAWASGTTKGMTTVPPANDYLYIVNGEAAGGTFTAGKFLIELYGY